MLFSYGLVKLFELQFSFPSITRLTEPLHQFSPMGLAWTFMGFSKGYNLTMGIIESCAILLLFKKTSTLGACISLMVSVQILLINYFFDVPVKMVSTALVLFSLLLLAPNFKNFYQLFFSSEPVILTKAKSYRSTRNWINKVLMIGKYVIIISCISIICFKTFSTKYYVSRMNSERNSFYGAYYIPNEESMQRTQLKIPFDWDVFIFQQKDQVFIRNQAGALMAYNLVLDTVSKELTIKDRNTTIFEANYQKSSDGNLLFIAQESDCLNLTLKKLNLDEIDLKTRGFNWIQNFPYNR